MVADCICWLAVDANKWRTTARQSQGRCQHRGPARLVGARACPIARDMSTRLHTPYDGSSKLFQIGLKPLDPAEWIEVDGRLPEYLVEKARVMAAHPAEVL